MISLIPKKINGVKAFAVDIDGTLTENGNGLVHLPAVSKLRFLERSGYRVVFVTGRSALEAYILSVFCGTTNIAVGENGGVVITQPDKFTILADKEKCIKGYNFLREKIPEVKIKPVFPRLSEVVLTRTFDMQIGKSVLEESGLGLYLSDSKYAYHINQIGVNKATGLTHALETLKIDASEVVAIGDSETDIPMFDLCGFSIALAHAEIGVKNRANHVVDGISGKGLSEAIDYISFNYLRDKK